VTSTMSEALSNRIRRHMEETGGWLPFDAFMREALYAPHLGYYESASVFGEAGDFVTGPDFGSWLSLAFADLIHWGWKQMGSPADWRLIEQGGGSGRLMCGIIKLLERTGCSLPEAIIAAEASEHMRQRQDILYRREGVNVLQVSDLSDIDTCESAIYFCNELPDAFPVRCFAWHRRSMFERGVCRDDGGFAWDEHPLNDPPVIDSAYTQAWPEGYRSEWNPLLDSWQADISACMKRGYVFCVDYGYAASEYYRPDRRLGTLLAHLRHQALDDVLSDPGSRDITAHIDFTALSRAGKRAGLDMGCWMSQGAWLAQSPSVQAHLRQLAESADVKSMQTISGVKRMLMPQGMGEMFKLSIQSFNVSAEMPPFLNRFNRLHALGNC